MIAETRASSPLIGSDTVQGTVVYGADGQEIGTIERVMIGKTSGGGCRTRSSVSADTSASAAITIPFLGTT
jgi:hypothetical protein